MLRIVEKAYRSDTGRQRSANEDSYVASPPLFAVADGMGGAQAGEVASQIAVEAFEPSARGDESPERYLRRITERANERIHDLSEQDSEHSGMGTTLTAALVSDDEVALAHVGDSRAYLFRNGELRLLTSDHSLVEELRRQGRLTEEEAEDHPQRSIITRALGPESDVEIDTMTYRARPGDVYLLCSDGLTTMIKEEEIAKTLAAAPDLDGAVMRLVRLANQAGGRDNITVIAFRLDEAEVPAAKEGATLVGPAAEEAGLTGEAVRTAARRRERRPGEEPPRPARRRRRLLIPLAVLLILGVLVGGAIYGLQQVYFLGTDEGGRLALYRGLPYDLPLGIELYSEVYSAPIRVDALPGQRQASATDHTLRSHEDAVSLISDLQKAALRPAASPSGQNTHASGGGQAKEKAGSGKGGSAGGGGHKSRRKR